MKKPYIIGISGGSGSGKTMFIKHLLKELPIKSVCFISQDNYYKPRQWQPKDQNGIRNFDLPDSMDLKGFYKDIRQLMAGKQVKIDEYTYNNPEIPAKEIVFFPAPVLIIEGIFIFYYQEIHRLIDLKIFIDAMEHIMLSRRIIRDEKERGYDLQDVLYRYQHHVMPSFRKYILPYKDSCDIIINNNEKFSIAADVIISHINNLLRN